MSLLELAGMYTPDITKQEFYIVFPAVERKLKQIVKREGDADGERLSPAYIAQLFAEQVESERVFRACIMAAHKERVYI